MPDPAQCLKRSVGQKTPNPHHLHLESAVSGPTWEGRAYGHVGVHPGYGSAAGPLGRGFLGNGA